MSGNIIDKAIDYIHEHGWYQGSLYGPDGSVCIVGAIKRTTGCGVLEYVNTAPYHAIVAEARAEGARSIVEFNDKIAQTPEDVFLLLKKASARLDEQTS